MQMAHIMQRSKLLTISGSFNATEVDSERESLSCDLKTSLLKRGSGPPISGISGIPWCMELVGSLLGREDVGATWNALLKFNKASMVLVSDVSAESNSRVFNSLAVIQ